MNSTFESFQSKRTLDPSNLPGESLNASERAEWLGLRIYGALDHLIECRGDGLKI